MSKKGKKGRSEKAPEKAKPARYRIPRKLPELSTPGTVGLPPMLYDPPAIVTAPSASSSPPPPQSQSGPRISLDLRSEVGLLYYIYHVSHCSSLGLETIDFTLHIHDSSIHVKKKTNVKSHSLYLKLDSWTLSELFFFNGLSLTHWKAASGRLVRRRIRSGRRRRNRRRRRIRGPRTAFTGRRPSLCSASTGPSSSSASRTKNALPSTYRRAPTKTRTLARDNLFTAVIPGRFLIWGPRPSMGATRPFVGEFLCLSNEKCSGIFFMRLRYEFLLGLVSVIRKETRRNVKVVLFFILSYSVLLSQTHNDVYKKLFN